MTILIILVCASLGVSFLCSMSEAVLLSMTPGQLADLSAKHPAAGKIWERFKSNIDRPIAAILVINTMANTMGASLSSSTFNDLYGGSWIVLFSLLFTYLTLQFSEILPKTLGVMHNRRLARYLATPLSFAAWLLTPVIKVIHTVNRLFESKSESKTHATMEEIRGLASLARMADQISTHQERIIKTASRLSQMNVAQVMIPVDQVVFFSTTQSLTDAVLAAHVDAHTRFPICEAGDPNKILGYVNFKEMIYCLRTNPKDPSLVGITHPMHFVSPDSAVADLLKFFVDEHEHMAIVRHADGRTLGLVTLEDIVEEMLGELQDEFDRLPHYIHALTGGVYIVGGGSPMSELCTRMGRTWPDARGTISSWMTTTLNRTPKAGDTVNVEGCEFLVRRTRRGKVFEAVVRVES